jgi:class 3 adenylate cyclase
MWPLRAVVIGGQMRPSVGRTRVNGIEVRAGLHTGEIEVRGDDVAGMAAHIGARVASSAGPGEVLVSATVKDLVVGSGISSWTGESTNSKAYVAPRDCSPSRSEFSRLRFRSTLFSRPEDECRP